MQKSHWAEAAVVRDSSVEKAGKGLLSVHGCKGHPFLQALISAKVRKLSVSPGPSLVSGIGENNGLHFHFNLPTEKSSI